MAVDLFSFSIVGIFLWIVVSAAGMIFFFITLILYKEIHPIIGIVSVASTIGAYYVMSKFVRWQN